MLWVLWLWLKAAVATVRQMSMWPMAAVLAAGNVTERITAWQQYLWPLLVSISHQQKDTCIRIHSCKGLLHLCNVATSRSA